MKKLLLLLPLMALLTACQSKKEICAQWAANPHSPVQTAKKLGIDISDINDPERSLNTYFRVGDFFAFYWR